MQLGITGHRPQKLGKGFNDHKFHRQIKKKILLKMQELPVEVVITGMALGVDQWAAEAAIKCGIPFVAAVPFKNQDFKWSSKFRQHYAWLLSKAVRTVLVDREEGYICEYAPPDVYSSSKMMTRNRWIIDQLTDQDVLMAVGNLSRESGTWHCVNVAMSQHPGLEIQNLNPENMTWRNYRQEPEYDDLPF